MIEITAADGTPESPLEDVPVLLATDDDYQRRPARRDCQPRERSAS